ncbi:MAG: pyridoxal phosphate-dependent aminotransferase [Pseudomonadota bacterium]
MALDTPPASVARIRPEIDALPDSQIVEVWKMGFEVPDVIGLWVGEGDIPTPQFICDAAATALKAGHTFYTHKRGIPALRQALSRYHARINGAQVAVDRITVTSAGMNAMMLIAEMLVGPGDNVLVVSPVWPNFSRAIEIMGGEAREVALEPGNRGWRLDLDKLFAAADARTRAIYMATPGNPTGWLMEPDEMRAVLEFCRRRGLFVISDEVYHRFAYDRPVAPSFLAIAGPDDPLFVVNSFSKSWAMTGWRVGWMVTPARLGAALDRLIEYNTSGGVEALQEACVVALEEGEPFVRELVERCHRAHDLVVRRLNAMKGVRVVPAPAAFYVMLQVEGMDASLPLAKKLVREARVGLAPGSAFGKGGEGHLRLCYASSHERLAKAMDRLEAFFGKK